MHKRQLKKSIKHTTKELSPSPRLIKHYIVVLHDVLSYGYFFREGVQNQ